MGQIRLALGCGWRNYGADWTHIDGGAYDHIDSDDIVRLPYNDNTVDIIYASHVLEYFDREDARDVLDEWYRVLKSDGVLRIAVPDLDRIFTLYNYGLFPLDSFLGPMYGKMSMGDANIYHKSGYNFELLSEILVETGFKSIYRYNWRNTDHADIDDHSQAYLPNKCKESGTLISLNIEARKINRIKVSHGMAGTKTYRCWAAMIQRCTNEKNPRYKDWGGRGINVEDKAWLNFVNFFNDMGECPKWGSIDRINNDNGYSKFNCKWSTNKMQGNNRRTNKNYAYDGKTLTLKEWSEEKNIKYTTLQSRIKKGWTFKLAINKPVKEKYRYLEINGVNKSISEWCREYDINFDTVWRRLEKGWTSKDAITTKLLRKRKEASK